MSSSHKDEDINQMSLKILYTVDNEPNLFLARSKKLFPVSIETVVLSSSPDEMPMRIGIIDSTYILNEVYKSSPELFPLENNGMSKIGQIDYNVYFKDVLEIDEPFVSLGLLSKLQGNGDFDQMQVNRNSGAEDTPLVMGRVCTNFTSVLTKPGSCVSVKPNMSQCETLEIKMRFCNVITNPNTRRSSIGRSIPAKRLNSNIGIFPATRTPTTTSNTVTSQPKQKDRNTNPMPAPKAFRTQSLPIWEYSKSGGIRSGTIAHKIYMADRNKKQLTAHNTHQQSGVLRDRKPTYQVTSLQNDTSVIKFRVDDSVSKRFDFMNKPKAKKSNTGTIKSSILNTTSKINTASKKSVKPKLAAPRRSSVSEASISTPNVTSKVENIQDEFSIINDSTSLQDLFDKNERTNKENVPPTLNANPSLLPVNLDDFFQLESKNFKNSDNEWLQGLLGTPRDNNCNIVPIDDETDNDFPTQHLKPNTDFFQNSRASNMTYDTDRTSPIDTLFMPLVDQDPKSTHAAKSASCPDQLKRSSLLMKGKRNLQSNHILTDEDEDTTFPVIQYSTSPTADRVLLGSTINSKILQSKHTIYSDEIAFDYYDDKHLDSIKKQKAIPSSPGSIFQPYKTLHQSSFSGPIDFSLVANKD